MPVPEQAMKKERMNSRMFSQFFPRAFVPGIIEPFLNRGEWAIHDVLPIVFNEIGAFDVKFATFNIMEVRQLSR